MIKFFKENINVLSLFTVIAIIFPIIILLPTPIGIIPYETGLTLIGYGGSILGGLLTLYGVWWTIKKNDEERKNDLSIEYRPIIKILNKKISFISNSTPINIFSKELSILMKIEMEFENVGRGEIYAGIIQCLYHDQSIDLNYLKNLEIVLCNERFKMYVEQLIVLNKEEISKGYCACLPFNIYTKDFIGTEHNFCFNIIVDINDKNIAHENIKYTISRLVYKSPFYKNEYPDTKKRSD